MARININDKLWADPRFKALCRFVGSEETALGRMVLVFRMAQEYYSDSESLIPIEIWDIQGFEYVEKVGFAERHSDGIYVKGSSENFEWLLKRKAAAKSGGLKSAQSRRDKYGSAQPNKQTTLEALPEANPKQTFENAEATPNPLSLSLSLSLNTNTSNKPCDHKGPGADEKSIMADAIVTAWNSAMTGVLPLVQRLTDKRKKHVIAQIKKYPEMEYWSSCFEKVKQSDFLTGRSTNWKCNFDWVMNENNRTKVMEGNYVNSKTEKPKNAWTDSGYGML
jgi:hypothetical protein